MVKAFNTLGINDNILTKYRSFKTNPELISYYIGKAIIFSYKL